MSSKLLKFWIQSFLLSLSILSKGLYSFLALICISISYKLSNDSLVFKFSSPLNCFSSSSGSVSHDIRAYSSNILSAWKLKISRPNYWFYDDGFIIILAESASSSSSSSLYFDILLKYWVLWIPIFGTVFFFADEKFWGSCMVLKNGFDDSFFSENLCCDFVVLNLVSFFLGLCFMGEILSCDLWITDCCLICYLNGWRVSYFVR